MRILDWLTLKKNIGWTQTKHGDSLTALIWRRPLTTSPILGVGPCDTEEELEKEIIHQAFKLLRNGKN